MPISLCILTAISIQTPVKLTAQQDHQRLMGLLNMTSIRPGADGFNAKAPNYQNVDESKATQYKSLPDPLVFRNGKPVKSARDWNSRKKELFEDFDREVYGRTPKKNLKVTWEVKATSDEKLGDIEVVKRNLIGHVDNSSCPEIKVDIQLNLMMPKNSKGKMPVILEFGFGGNFPQRPNPNPNAPRPKSWQQQVVERGWAAAVIVPTSYQADNGGGLTEGVIGLMNHGQPRKVDDWGALKAWGWGASRAIDYFATEKNLDPKQVAIEGISRYGKAALVTMAFEPRMAMAFVGSSGAGGAKLHRRDYGEKVENIASSGEYHWMAGNYIKYAGPLTANDLPVDSHELIALCAPRPVFVGCGSPKVEGTWVDDKGMFLATLYATPVYELLGKTGLKNQEMPPEETSLTSSDLAFRQHSGGHTNEPNWPSFLEYASRYFKVK